MSSTGGPSLVKWRPFLSAVDYPPLRGPGGFEKKDLPVLKKNHTKPAAAVVAGPAPAEAPVGPADEEVIKYFEMLRTKMTDRFAQLRRAFRQIDEDASGTLDHKEVKQILETFNLGIPDAVLDRIISLADFDGDGSINYAEFARIMTSEDVVHMKNTLEAAERGVGSGVNAARVARKMAEGGANRLTNTVTDENVKLRRTGPGLDKIRRAHKTLREAILSRYSSITLAFSALDTDGSGKLRRDEVQRFLRSCNTKVPDQVISALIDYIDIDQDVKTISLQEFINIMGTETLH